MKNKKLLHLCVCFTVLCLFSTSLFAQKESKERSNTDVKTAQVLKAESQQALVKDARFVKKTEPNRFNKSSDQPQKMVLKHVSTKKTNSSTDATVTLMAGDVWGDGTGYQMLLDADANTFGTTIPATGQMEPGDIPATTYAEFEYKIPTNADGVLTTTNIVFNNSISITIPPGTYDFCVTNPSSSSDPNYNRMWIASGPYGRQDNFVFVAGQEYIFEVTLVGQNDNVALKKTNDAALSNMVLPSPGLGLTNAENITVTISNHGSLNIPANALTLNYSINGGATVTESYATAIASQSSTSFTFTTKANFSTPNTTYNVTAWVSYPGDEDATNDTVSSKTVHFGTQNLPFVENFIDATAFSMWTVLNENNDNSTWKFSTTSSDITSGSARYSYSTTNQADDYLISLPINMPAGNCYITYKYKVESGSYPESFKVLYGSSSNVSTMTILNSHNQITNTTWNLGYANFNIPTAGVYYFAFHATSDADKYYLYVDNVLINAGAFVTTPDLSVDKLILPMPGCGLSTTEPITAIVSNVGLAPITSISLNYTIDGGSPVNETFTVNINPQGVDTLTFTQMADFSVLKDYIVVVTGTVVSDTVVANNSLTGKVINSAPISTLPFASNFSNASDIDNWNPSQTGSWGIDNSGGYAAYEEGTSLLSKCVTLTPGAYKISYDYLAGIFYLIFVIPDDFKLSYGLSGTDMSTWTTIKSYSEAYTEEVIASDHALFTVQTAGDYVFAFTSESLGVLTIYSAKIETPAAHDVAITGLSSSLPRLTPAVHSNGAKFALDIVNNGANAENVALTIKQGSTVIASGTEPLALGETKTVELTSTLGSLPVGAYTFTADASIASDANIADNTMNISGVITDSVFAWDNAIAPFEDGIGSNSGAISFGNVYTLATNDILTSVSLGLAEIPAIATWTIGIAVHSVAADGSLTKITERPFIRGAGGDVTVFDLPNLALSAGTYYFEVQQLDANNIGIAYDDDPVGYFYLPNTNNVLEAVPGFGYLMIRPNFGPGVPSSTANTNIDQLISIYPNPAKEALHIDTKESIQSITIYSVLGKQVYSVQGAAIPQVINVNDFEGGVYFIRIKTDKGETTQKFVVTK